MLGCAAIWIQLPSLDDPVYINAAIAASETRLKRLQDLAASPETNAYLHPQFLPFWGEQGEYQENSEVEKTIVAWSKYYSWNYEERLEHRPFLEKRDPQYMKARADFEQLLGPLGECLERPVFAPPNFNWQKDTYHDNFIRLRQLATALQAYAESKQVEGGPEEGLRALRLCWRLGALQTGRGEIPLMLGISFQAMTDGTLLDRLGPSEPMSEKAWLELAKTLRAESFSAVQFTHLLQDDLVSTERYYSAAAKGSLPAVNGQPVPKNSWWENLVVQRDLRMEKNGMTVFLKSHQPDSRFQLSPQSTQFSIQDWLVGRSSFMLDIKAQNWPGLSGHLLGQRTRMEGLALCAGLFAYRSRHGDLPATLDEVRSLGLDPDSSFPWESMEYHPPDTLLLPLKDADDPKKFGALASSRGSWMTPTSEGLLFTLTPSKKE